MRASDAKQENEKKKKSYHTIHWLIINTFLQHLSQLVYILECYEGIGAQPN